MIDPTLADRFFEHELDDEQSRHVERLRAATLWYAGVIDGVCPNGRPRALALTKLEEASMWAVKAVATKG